VASEPRPGTIEASLLAMDREWGHAYLTGDASVLERVLAPDWIGWFETQPSTRESEIASLRSGHLLLEDIVDEATVRVFGETAVIQARERGRVADASGSHWVTHHITDVFVRRDGRWTIVASHDSLIPNPASPGAGAQR
jgi:hypothetical protein